MMETPMEATTYSIWGSGFRVSGGSASRLIMGVGVIALYGFRG